MTDNEVMRATETDVSGHAKIPVDGHDGYQTDS